MRGEDHQQSHVFSYLSPEERVRPDHPLRAIREMVDVVLSQLSRSFDGMYAKVGRPSIAPEKLLRAQLLQMLYSIRSERLLMEEMDYNLLFRWFVGLNADDPVWDATVFTKNRDRLLQADVAKEFLATVNFRGERRSNQTHASKTDPEAQMARKGEGKESKLSYSGNLWKTGMD
jgi:transposase